MSDTLNARRVLTRVNSGILGSRLATSLWTVAAPLFVIGGSHQLLALAAVGLARLVPDLVFGPIGGYISDRFDRRRLLPLLSAGRGLCFLLASLLIFYVPSVHTVLVVLVTLADAILVSWQSTAENATLKLISDETGNVVTVVTSSSSARLIADLTGMTISLILAAALPSVWTFFFQALVMGTVTIVYSRLRSYRFSADASQRYRKVAKLGSGWRNLLSTIGAAPSPVQWALFTQLCTNFAMPLTTFSVTILAANLWSADLWIAPTMMAFTGGSLVMVRVMRAKQFVLYSPVQRNLFVAVASAVPPISCWVGPIAFVAGSFVAGAAVIISASSAQAAIQQFVPSDIAGTIHASNGLVSRCAASVGILIISLAVSVARIQVCITVLGALLVLALVGSIIFSRRPLSSE